MVSETASPTADAMMISAMGHRVDLDDGDRFPLDVVDGGARLHGIKVEADIEPTASAERAVITAEQIPLKADAV